jgi:hypothetical protein
MLTASHLKEDFVAAMVVVVEWDRCSGGEFPGQNYLAQEIVVEACIRLYWVERKVFAFFK